MATATSHTSTTLYIPVVSPPTPAPSPGPSQPVLLPGRELGSLSPSERRRFLSTLIFECTAEELVFLSTTISNILRRDFLHDLPPELAVYILGFIDEPNYLCRAACVSKYWSQLVNEEWLWKRLCAVHRFEPDPRLLRSHLLDTPYSKLTSSFPYRKHFRTEYMTVTNWRTGGTLLRVHRVPLLSLSSHAPTQTLAQPTPAAPDPPPSSAIPTSLAIDAESVVVGLANSRIHIFSARTGVLSRTLVGHSTGVWAVALVKGSGQRSSVTEATDGHERIYADGEKRLPKALRHALGFGAPRPGPAIPPLPSDPAGSSQGWGQPNAMVVSGGCDKDLRVWDVQSGYCIYTLPGHTSTIRCLKVLHHRPIAVSGSRDCTLRVWDIQKGKMLRVLEGHVGSVRDLDVYDRRVVSGSYDTTCRVWDIDTGECLHVLRGHFQQVYSVAFDGVRIASGGIDTTVRVWDAETGVCLALLQGHTALVTLLQLTPTVLVTGGSDGRVITFSLSTRRSPQPSSGPAFTVIQKVAAHDSTVTSLQLSDRFLITAGNDGRVRLFTFDVDTGMCEYVREVSEPSESVWKVGFVGGTCAVMCRRAGKTVMEIWSYRPKEM